MSERPDRKQVHVRLAGRVGNQMFQYAAGRALATRLDADLTLVTSRYGPDGEYQTELDAFRLDVAVAGRWPREPWRYPRGPWQWTARRWLDHRRRCRLPIFQEPHYHVADRFFTTADSCCIGGHWQSWQYFDAVADRIRADFDLGRFAGPATVNTLADISGRPTVAIHVRRGDYVRRQTVYHLCDRGYYDRARQALDGIGEGLHYLVSSDEPAAAQALLGDWPDCTFVGGHTIHEDMLLISRCRHYVIANSSFSWWAAWLGATAGSQVIAPRQWFSREHQSRTDIGDLHPADWFTL